MLSRDTHWRQGSVITHDSALMLNIFKNDPLDKYAIVISHDCDIPNEKDEFIEVIIGTKILALDHNFAAARNIRSLHLTYNCTSPSEKIYIHLQHSERQSIPKVTFEKTAEIQTDLTLSAEEKRTLKQWLAARYGRPAFPNEFEKRLRKDKKLEDKLNKILKPAEKYVIGIFFDLGEERFVDLSRDAPYFLRISIVYESVNGPAARAAVQDCAISIVEEFYKIYGKPETATEIALESCQAIADTLFSMADIRKTDQWWRFDYISLRESPTSPYLPIGVTSA